jgi:glucokinase
LTQWVLASDLGGSKMAGALVDPAGHIINERTYPTDAGQGMEAVARRLAEMLKDICRSSGPDRPLGVGVAAPGLIDSEAGEIRYAANIPGANQFPLRQRLQESLSLPVVIDNDLRLHALGESAVGAARNIRHFLFVAVGTGVGSALYVGGQPYAGAHGAAGEIGHIIIDERPAAPLCQCGRRGCLETVAAGPAMTAYFRQQAADHRLGLELEPIDLPLIAGWLDRPDAVGELARETVRRGARALGRGLATAITLLDPECVILGGGVAHLGAPWLEVVRQTAAEYSLPQARLVPIELGVLGGKAALVGAATLVRQQIAAGREND